MPFVEISLWPGRSDETKARIIEEVSKAVASSSGAPMEAVEVIIRDIPKSSWGRGGRPFSQTHPDTG